MIDRRGAREIIELYEKHGWTLRRALFCSEPSPEIADLTGNIPCRSSPIDAFWFSRRSRPGRETWELRRLTGSPFALVAVIDERDSETLDATLETVERRMSAAGS